MANKDKYPEDAVSESLARLIAAKDIPDNVIASQISAGKKSKSWLFWVLIGTTMIFFFIVYRKRKKKNKE